MHGIHFLNSHRENYWQPALLIGATSIGFFVIHKIWKWNEQKNNRILELQKENSSLLTEKNTALIKNKELQDSLNSTNISLYALQTMTNQSVSEETAQKLRSENKRLRSLVNGYSGIIASLRTYNNDIKKKPIGTRQFTSLQTDPQEIDKRKSTDALKMKAILQAKEHHLPQNIRLLLEKNPPDKELSRRKSMSEGTKPKMLIGSFGLNKFFAERKEEKKQNPLRYLEYIKSS